MDMKAIGSQIRHSAIRHTQVSVLYTISPPSAQMLGIAKPKRLAQLGSPVCLNQEAAISLTKDEKLSRGKGRHRDGPRALAPP